MSSKQSWKISHFSLANPRGQGHGDVAKLLRCVADAIDERQPLEVQDTVFHKGISGGADDPSVTVYFHKRRGVR